MTEPTERDLELAARVVPYGRTHGSDLYHLVVSAVVKARREGRASGLREAAMILWPSTDRKTIEKRAAELEDSDGV